VSSINLRDFPEDLHKRVEAKAALGGITLKDLIINALTEYLKKRGGDFYGKNRMHIQKW